MTTIGGGGGGASAGAANTPMRTSNQAAAGATASTALSWSSQSASTTTLPPQVWFQQTLQAYWQQDDFRPLHHAGKAILAALRDDEAAPNADLYRQMCLSGPASHLYFRSSTTSTSDQSPTTSGGVVIPLPVTRFRHVQSIPLPTELRQALTAVQSHSFMGLFATAGIAWMTVDHVVYLWNYYQQPTEPGISRSHRSILSFAVPSRQSIITVGLVRPKPGVFREDVEWCVVLSTPDEVLLCVLVRLDGALAAAAAAAGADNNNNNIDTLMMMMTTTTPHYQLVPTPLRLSTDNVRMLSIASTQQGRIFLGGDDGCLYEMTYQGGPENGTLSLDEFEDWDGSDNIHNNNDVLYLSRRLNQFYDHGQPIPDTLTARSDRDWNHIDLQRWGKRAWQSIRDEVANVAAGGNDEGGTDSRSIFRTPRSRRATKRDGDPIAHRPHKCRKINRTSHVSSLVRAVVPEFVIQSTAYLLGVKTSTGGGKITHMVVDEARSCLYTLSALGWICVFDLSRIGPDAASAPPVSGAPGKHEQQARLVSVTAVPRTARWYLEEVARGRVSPLTSSTSRASGVLGALSFPGGGAAAQAGVGGMVGARDILKCAETNPSSSSGTGSSQRESSILRPISIHVVPPTESSRITLVAVTEGGLRLYFSSLDPRCLGTSSSTSTAPLSRRQRRNSTTFGSSFSLLAPSNRLTLCHIRAPPPVNQHSSQDWSAFMDVTVQGGLIPRISPINLRPQQQQQLQQQQGGNVKLDSTMYHDGIFVMAMQAPRVSGTAETTTGDVLVATTPDSVARKVETPTTLGSSSATMTRRATTVEVPLSAPGGISETISLPMLDAYGPATTSNGLNTVLSGGIVWDMSAVRQDYEDLAVYRLLMDSKTPSDGELDTGLPPAFVPPSKIRTHQSTQPLSWATTTSVGIVADREMIVPNPPTSSIALKLFANMLLPKPFRYRVAIQQPLRLRSSFRALAGSGVGGEAVQQPAGDFADYRISQRDGSRGFSLTAAEMTPRGSSRSLSSGSKTRSARLRSWLLRPDTAPLNSFATQWLGGSKEVVALNVGGLHFFASNSILSDLIDSLIQAGENIKKDAAITGFFKSFGFKEGCAMCLALAIGCGTQSHGGDSLRERLRSRASSAALGRAYVPKLIPLVEQTTHDSTIIGSIGPSSDPMAPPGYEFRPSAIYEGLTLLFSRLIRPIWHKPAVVVTEGCTIRLRWSDALRPMPAKVELLLDDASLEAIQTPLRNLLSLMKNDFSRAIRVVPGLSHRAATLIDVEDENVSNLPFTTGLQIQSQNRAVSGSTALLSPREVEHMAHLIEEKNIHGLFRLLSRVVQLLSLMGLLRRAHNLKELREVDWGLLHGLTFAQLTQTPEGQERLESLLNDLVTGSASVVSAVAPSAQAGQYADLLAEQCYLFFSPGSRFAYLGLREAREASSQHDSAARNTFATQAARYLRQAAEHWFSAPLITGRILRSRGKETYSEIVRRAKQFGSPLAKAVDVLVELQDVASIVHICLVTASNFIPGTAKSLASGTLSPRSSYELAWEQQLYHRKREVNETDGMSMARSSATSSSSPSQIVPYGAEVSYQDAIETCYAILLDCVSNLLTSGSSLGNDIIFECAASKDQRFRDAFYSHLLDSGHKDILLQISSKFLEDWLREKNDPELLWEYLSVQGRHKEAADIAFSHARNSSLEIPLIQRIEVLIRALHFYKTAENERQYGRSGFGESIWTNSQEAEELLRLARLQSRILRAAQTSEDSRLALLTTEQRRKLENSLIEVSDLFNSYASQMGFFDHCLVMLHICGKDATEHIERLWMNVIQEQLVPCATRSDRVYDLLMRLEFDSSAVELLPPTAHSTSTPLFESGFWIKPLELKVIELGKELYGSGADYTFPVETIMSILEELRICFEDEHNDDDDEIKIHPGWALLVMAESGVPYLLILSTFDPISLPRQSDGGGGGSHGSYSGQSASSQQQRGKEFFVAQLELLSHWVRAARSGPTLLRDSAMSVENENPAKREMVVAAALGRLSSVLNGIRSELESLREGPSLLDQLEDIQREIHSLVHVAVP